MKHVTIFLRADGTLQSLYVQGGVLVEVVDQDGNRMAAFAGIGPDAPVTVAMPEPGRPFTDLLTEPAVTPPQRRPGTP